MFNYVMLLFGEAVPLPLSMFTLWYKELEVQYTWQHNCFSRSHFIVSIGLTIAHLCMMFFILL